MKNKKKFRIILVLLLLGVTLGYAVLGTSLTINGNSKLAGSSWDIHFNNVVPKSGGVPIGTGDHGAVITQGDNTEVTYAVTLSKPGDFYEFNVDAVNTGTVDGMIDTITSTIKIGEGEVTPITSSSLPAYLSYSATYYDGGEIAQNHLLKAGETETYKVRIEFKRDIENNQLPATEQTLTFNFAVGYVQADSNGQEVLHQTTVYSTNQVSVGQPIPSKLTTYQTPEEVRAAFDNRPFFLKHTITNNVVTENYVGFVVTSEMVGANPGMTTGTYYLRGGVDEESLTDKPIYEANKAVLLRAFGSSYCTDSASSFRCSVSDLSAEANSDGRVFALGNDPMYCLVYQDGASLCCND